MSGYRPHFNKINLCSLHIWLREHKILRSLELNLTQAAFSIPNSHYSSHALSYYTLRMTIVMRTIMYIMCQRELSLAIEIYVYFNITQNLYSRRVKLIKNKFNSIIMECIFLIIVRDAISFNLKYIYILVNKPNIYI